MILTRTYCTELHVRDDRVITGTLVPYGQPVQIREYGKTYTEDFAPGAFASDVDRAAEVELTALHPRSGDQLPIGVTLSLTDTSTGLDGEWRISETSFGDEVLTLVKDRALRNLSAGFAEGRNRWHTRNRVTRLSATLDHAALVRRGAYPGAAYAAHTANQTRYSYSPASADHDGFDTGSAVTRQSRSVCVADLEGGPVESAVRAALAGLTGHGVASAMAEVAYVLARSLDVGAGLATAAVARELRATLLGATASRGGEDDDTEDLLDRLAGPAVLDGPQPAPTDLRPEGRRGRGPAG